MISSWLCVGCVWNEASSSPSLCSLLLLFLLQEVQQHSVLHGRHVCLLLLSVPVIGCMSTLRTGATSTCVSELTLSMLRSVPAGPGGVVGVGVLCVVCFVCLSPAATVRLYRQPVSRRRADEQRLFISLRLSELNSGWI